MNLCRQPDPVLFTGNIAQNWKDFEEQLHWFLAGTESASKSDEIKIGIMLSHAGKEAREVYKTLPWAAEGDDKKFDKVTKAFRAYCEPRKNILYERHGFWNLQQLEEESIDGYLTRLKLKVDACEYDKEGWPAAVRLEVLRDKFVFGLLDDSLKERLLRENELDLTKAVEIAHRQESSKRHIKDMSTKPVINTLSRGHTMRHSSRQGTDTYITCRCCGKQHNPKQCPAYGQICTRCQKPNHFAKMCKTKLVPRKTVATKGRQKYLKKLHVVETDQETESDQESQNSDESYTLGMYPLKINGIEKQTAWLSTVKTQSGKVTFKLDTGAEANVIPIEVFNQLTNTPQVQPTKTKLTAYGGNTIKPLGTCTLQCTSKHNCHDVKFYVVNADSQPILGLTDCEELALLEHRNTPITGMSYSPAQLLMNRRLRGCLPMTTKSLQPSVPTLAKRQLQKSQKKQKYYYDGHTKSLPPLEPDDVVCYQTSTHWEPAVIIQKHSAPRSYDLITTSGRTIRRNRRHLKPTQEIRPAVIPPIDDDISESSSSPLQSSRPDSTLSNTNINQQVTERRTRSGRLVKPPLRYGDN